jgi:hypothetical protein
MNTLDGNPGYQTFNPEVFPGLIVDNCAKIGEKCAQLF